MVNATASLATLWRSLLLHAASDFGRLAILASCVEQNTGQYRATSGADALLEPHLLQTLHELIWESWLHAPLRQQEAALRAYLGSLSEPLADLVAGWRCNAPYLAFPPASARQEERVLFASNMEVLLQLFVQQSKQEIRSEIERDAFSLIPVFITEHHANPTLCITDLAAYLNLSVRHVRRLFEQNAGCTFAAYLRAVRIEAAQDFLHDSTVDIKEVCWRIGYSSPSHFSKDFRAVVGYTPTGYRKLLLTPKRVEGGLHSAWYPDATIAMAGLR